MTQRVVYSVKWITFSSPPTKSEIFNTKEEAVEFAREIYKNLDKVNRDNYPPRITKTTRENIEVNYNEVPDDGYDWRPCDV